MAPSPPKACRMRGSRVAKPVRAVLGLGGFGTEAGFAALVRRCDAVPLVGVAQLVEPRIVDPVVVGSSPIIHPKVC